MVLDVILKISRLVLGSIGADFGKYIWNKTYFVEMFSRGLHVLFIFNTLWFAELHRQKLQITSEFLPHAPQIYETEF